MIYLELTPSPPLRPFVQLIWCLECDDAGPESTERIAPDGIVELVFHYRDPMEVCFAGERFAEQPRSSLVSQTRRFVDIRPARATGLISVRFRPWGAYHFLPLPVSAFRDDLVSADDVWDHSTIRQLEEGLAAAVDAPERVELVEQFLLGQLKLYHKGDVEPLVRAVWSRRGRLRVPQLCHELGVTERTAQRYFAAATGTSPKGFIRLSRFLNACAILHSGGWHNLTEVGHVCGYYDQAHFIADFKAHAGLTPGEFLVSPRFSFLRLD